MGRNSPPGGSKRGIPSVPAYQAAFYRGFLLFQAYQKVKLVRLQKWISTRVYRAWYAGTLRKKALEKSGLRKAEEEEEKGAQGDRGGIPPRLSVRVSDYR